MVSGLLVALLSSYAAPVSAQTDSDNPQVLLQFAASALQSGDFQNAFVASNKALRLTSGYANAYLLRSLALSSLSANVQARTDANLAGQLYRNAAYCDQYLYTSAQIDAFQSGFGQTDPFDPITSFTNSSLLSSPLYLLGLSGLTTGTPASLLTGLTGTTGTTGTTTNGINGTSSTGTSTSSSSSSSSSTASIASFSSGSDGSVKLPVAEDLTAKEKAEKAAAQQMNIMLAQTILPIATCAAIQSTNLTNITAAWVQQGITSLKAGLYTAADAAFNRALELSKDNALARAGLGLAYASQGGATIALSELNTAVSLAPNSAFALTARAIYWIQQQNYAQAAQDLATAQSVDQANPETMGNMAMNAYSQWKLQAGSGTTPSQWALANTGLLQSALAICTQAIGQWASYAAFYNLRAAVNTDLAWAFASDAAQAASYAAAAAADRNTYNSLLAVAFVTTSTTTTTAPTGYNAVQTALNSPWPYFLTLPVSAVSL